MNHSQIDIFSGSTTARLQMSESIELTIQSLQAYGQWPDGWDGDEPVADQPLEITYYQDGAQQPSLFGLGA